MFTKYIETFLSLLERFVVAQEKRNELLENTQSRMVNLVEEAGKTTLAQDVETAEKNVKAEEAKESASNGSADGAATRGRGRGRSRAQVAEPEPEAEDVTEEQAELEQTSTGRRRQRVRAADAQQEEAQDEQASTGRRRQRVRAADKVEEPEPEPEPEVVPDTPEQADDRQEVEELCQLMADVDKANAECKAYFKKQGWNTATDIPGDRLGDVIEDLNVIADKYFDDAPQS